MLYVIGYCLYAIDYCNYSVYFILFFEQKNQMPRESSEDLRWRVIYLYTDGFSTIDIANTLYLSKSTVVRIIKIYKKWACVINPFKGVFGRRKLFNRNDMYILQSLIKDKVNWYLDELVYEMENLTGKRASISTLWRSLHYLGITRKKVLKQLV
jgi:transposase